MKLPKLFLRDLFWLVLVAALGCAWWQHHRRHVRLETELHDGLRSNQELLRDRESLLSSVLQEQAEMEHYRRKQREMLLELTASLKSRGILWYRSTDGEIRFDQWHSADDGEATVGLPPE
jgi:hypothetical protein